MGSTSSKRFFKSEKLFWGAWYNKTGDYSVGPFVTIYNDQNINEYNRECTRDILSKHRTKDGKYEL